MSIKEKVMFAIRKALLGESFRHELRCHPQFTMFRVQSNCRIYFKNNYIASIPLAGQLKNHFTKTCFTIATGPSLADFDLNLIKDHDTISLNCAIKKFNAVNLKPTHCIIIDRRIFENQWDCVEASIRSGANCFFSYIGLSRICERNPELLKNGNIYLIESTSRKFGIPRPSIAECLKKFEHDSDIYLDDSLPDYCRSIGFSTNLEKGLFSGKTVATWATQLAFGLGYQNNFIVGMDLGGTGKKHFYAEENNGIPDFLKDYEPHIRACFELAKKAYDDRGLGIYNLSEKSSLPNEIIRKITIEKALEIADNGKRPNPKQTNS